MKPGPKNLWIPDDDNHSSVIEAQSNYYQYFAVLADKGGVAVDGGAHVGYWTRQMARDYKIVIAFEPRPENYECLVRNLEQGHTSIVKMCNAGLGSEHSFGTLKRGGRPGNSGAWYVDFDADNKDIQIIDLDSFISEQPLQFIKLDIEGMEHQALEGGRELITRDRPVIVIERNTAASENYNLNDNAAHKWLLDLGYEIQLSNANDYCYVSRD